MESSDCQTACDESKEEASGEAKLVDNRPSISVFDTRVSVNIVILIDICIRFKTS